MNANGGQPPEGGTCLSGNKIVMILKNQPNGKTGAPPGGSARRYGKAPQCHENPPLAKLIIQDTQCLPKLLILNSYVN